MESGWNVSEVSRPRTRGLSALAGLEAALDSFCAGFDADVVTASDAAEVLARLCVIERRVTAVNAAAARRVEQSRAWKHQGHRSMPDWLAAKTGEPVSSGAGLLDTARKLEAAPATADALASGDVSVAAAREIADAVAVDPTAEAGLLALAGEHDHRRLMEEAARVRQAATSGESEAARHERLRKRRYARTSVDPDGLVLLRAGFAPQDWAPFASLLQGATDHEFRRARRDGRREPVQAYAADALLRLLTPAAAPAPQPVGGSDLRPPADLADGAQHPGHRARGCSRTRTSRASRTGSLIRRSRRRSSPRQRSWCWWTRPLLRRGHRLGGERCEIAGVGTVSVGWVRELLPDAISHALVHDGTEILGYASATRSIRKAVHLAVKARDWRCVVRGCGRARRLQRDHRHDYALGGSGSSDNLNLLCAFHHHQKTCEGAKLDKVGDEYHWTPPGSAEIWSSKIGAGLTLWDVDPPPPDC